MKTKALCLLLLLALTSVPAFAEPAPQVTLADIFAPASAPAPAAALPDIVQEFACFPACTTDAYCQNICQCTIAYCVYRSICGKKVCDCTVCP